MFKWNTALTTNRGLDWAGTYTLILGLHNEVKYSTETRLSMILDDNALFGISFLDGNFAPRTQRRLTEALTRLASHASLEDGHVDFINRFV
jgi:hypothetical protein